jgi:hypothetical protein
MNLAEIPRVSRYTYRYHFLHEMLNNVFVGVFGLADVVARKGLHATDAETLTLSVAAPSFSLLASLWAVLMEGRSKRPFIIACAIFGRGALLLTAIVSSSAWFVALCCAVALADPIFIPAQQAIFQANYDSSWRGRLQGRIILGTRLILIGASLGAAYLLDQDPTLYQVLFPLVSVVGVVAYLQFALMKVRWRESRAAPAGLGGWNRIRKILKDHPEFDAFERNFYLYGVAFHLLVPVNVILLVDHLHISYTDNALSRILLFHLCVAIFSPLAGQLLDRWRASWLSGHSFLLLSLYPIILLAAYGFQSIGIVYLAYAWFGLAMAGVNTAWNLGAMQFSGNEDASIFMGIHVSAVGVRGLCAPIIGYKLMEYFGMEAPYIAAAGLFLLAGVLMFRLDRRLRALSQ